MALIPSDVGIRMRMQTEADLLQPVAPAHEIPSDLPELRAGQVFSARIQEALPDNTYKALVAGKQLTLQLPEGARSGDLLELVVIDRSPKVVIARQVEAGVPTAPEETGPYPFAKFTPAARMIGQLLPSEGASAPAVQLNRGQPLLAQAPQAQGMAAQLAPVLAKTVTQSGMFYEAHQAQWVVGKFPLSQLLQEPQGQRSSPAAFAQAEIPAPRHEATTAPQSPVTANSILQALTTATEKVDAGKTAATTLPPAQSSLSQHIPDALRPLVQQQLEAGASQRMFWHGTIWPQQTLDWAIEWDGERAAAGDEENAAWRTALSLTTPRLGRIDASLQLTSGGVRIALSAPDGAGVADLKAASPELAAALSAAGVPLLGFQVKPAETP